MTVNTHVGFEIRVLSNLIYRRINQMSAQEGETLTANQDWVLHFLIQSQGRDIMQRDIEKEFSIRRSTASRTLQLMERNGYIRREPVSYDARLKKLVVTEKGTEARDRMIDRLNRFEAELQSGISPEELNQLTSTIRKLEENIK
ncbi:MarR family winged helix-turn-helix transcriptional regulator [uncultured Clostridium sp.]|uniref:MarR family winged helix-turn-helix transcriptional regulator n=1 Tax=uncultured Clostridium sp. TaxID=59620 RepID=UPI0025F21FF2|nr:MarR family winged helix-turn-helix transcriptional regulator [uncultured Clostridium sp.]